MAVKELGEINSGTFYPLTVFQSRVGWGRHAMRQARRRGLKVRYLHGTAGVMADDFFDYLKQVDQSEEKSGE